MGDEVEPITFCIALGQERPPCSKFGDDHDSFIPSVSTLCTEDPVVMHGQEVHFSVTMKNCGRDIVILSTILEHYRVTNKNLGGDAVIRCPIWEGSRLMAI